MLYFQLARFDGHGLSVCILILHFRLLLDELFESKEFPLELQLIHFEFLVLVLELIVGEFQLYVFFVEILLVLEWMALIRLRLDLFRAIDVLRGVVELRLEATPAHGRYWTTSVKLMCHSAH